MNPEDNPYFKLIQQYFPQDQWMNAYRVMMGESGGNPGAIGDDYMIKGEIRPSHGLFQIRQFPDRPSPEQLRDPEQNVKYAAQMWKSQGWQPWTVARELGLVPGYEARQSTIDRINNKTQTSRKNRREVKLEPQFQSFKNTEKQEQPKISKADEIRRALRELFSNEIKSPLPPQEVRPAQIRNQIRPEPIKQPSKNKSLIEKLNPFKPKILSPLQSKIPSPGRAS